MKRIIPIMIVTIMLLMNCLSVRTVRGEVLSEATETAAESSVEEHTAETRILNDLLGYIFQSELMYGDVQWVLEYFNRFDDQKSWENLQFARSSLVIAKMDISKCCLQESEMTPEDQMELMRRGIDISFLENIGSLFQEEKTFILNACLNLHHGIMGSIYLKDDWKVCMRHVALLKDLMSYDIQYLANTVDWVLATMNNEEITKSFYDVMKRYCPKTYACQSETPETPKTIEIKTNALLDQIEALRLDEAKITGMHRDRLHYLTELIEKGDYVTIGENLLDIPGMPLAIFYPPWYDDEKIYYYWEENGEISKTPTPGTKLERIPDVCQIKVSGITKDEVTDYQVELEKAGLPCLGSKDENTKLSIFYQYDGSQFALIWQEETTTILMMKNPFCFVPRWYLPAQQVLEKGNQEQ